jgi:hypothetical protein
MFLAKLRVGTAVALALAVVVVPGVLVVRAQPEAAPAASAPDSGGSGSGGTAKPEGDAPREAAAKAEKNPLSGEWAKTDTKESGRVRLYFDAPLPGGGAGGGFDVEVRKLLRIRWTPPQEEAGAAPPLVGTVTGGLGGAGGAGAGPLPPGAPRATTVGYQLKEKDGKKVIVIRGRDQGDVEVPYRLDGDTLTLDGGVYEVGGRAGRTPFLKVTLKGEWKRVNQGVEDKLRKAFPGMDVEGFAIQLEVRGQRLVAAANKALVQPDGRIRLEDCAVARLPAAGDGAKAASATTVRSAHAVFQLGAPARTLADLGGGKIIAVEFADGVRMNLKDQ